MSATWRVVIFGKSGCDKCAFLRRRVEALLAEDGWSDFEMAYADVETEEGLAAFCRAECINPNRLPAMLVMERAAAPGGWRPLARPASGPADPAAGVARLYTYVGLQTDYSEQGRGILSPKAIRSELEEARQCRTAPPADGPA